jgi:6-phosphofructokinase 1
MGRSSGIIAINSGLACAADYILVPEIEVDLVKIAENIKNHRKGKRHTLIIVAEGAAKASDVAASIKLLVGHEVRVSVLGHIQRGGSPSALDRLLAAEFGKKAVDLLIKGESDCMTAIQGKKIVSVPFEYAVNSKKDINRELYQLAHILS